LQEIADKAQYIRMIRQARTTKDLQ
jgi:hypothetical protein